MDAIVEGAVQRSGDRVRITAQLLHGKTDRHLWAESYERDFRDVLKLQSELAQAIAGEIKITLTPEERRLLGDERQVDPKAYRTYLQGRYQFSKRTIAAFERSIQLFRQALEEDPASALAYAGLAESYGILPFAARPNRESFSPKPGRPRKERWNLTARLPKPTPLWDLSSCTMTGTGRRPNGN